MRLFLMTCDQFSTFCKHPHISLSTFKGKTGPTPVKLIFKAEPPRQVDYQGDYLCSGCACTKELRSRGVTFCYWGSQVCHLITILSFTIKRKVAKVSFYTKRKHPLFLNCQKFIQSLKGLNNFCRCQF